MAADQHEALIRAYIDEVFNGHRVDALDKYWDDDLTSHWLGMETIHGLSAWRAALTVLEPTFSTKDAAGPVLIGAGQLGWQSKAPRVDLGGSAGLGWLETTSFGSL